MTADARSVSRNRFEYEEGGAVAYLEFDNDGQWLTLWHTEVPSALRGKGIASMLARTAFEHAREQKLKVDVICPVVANFVAKNPEFKDLLGR